MPSAHSASPEKTKGKMRNERAILAAVLVAMALPSLFVAAFLFHHGNNAFQPDPLREGAAACGHSSVSGSAGQQYQYEGNPCHILYSNSSVSAFNYTLSGGVDAAVALHDGLLLVPMSQPMNNLPLPSVSSSGTTDPLPTLNSAFIRPSYFPPSYWNFNGTWGKLAAYDAITGKLLWEDNFSAPVMSQPIVVNGTAYISTGDDFVNNAYKRNGIYAINLSTGRIAWSYPTVAEHMPTPLYYNGTLIILPGAGTGYDSNSVFALDSGTGLPLWHIGIGAESAMSSPALVGNTMYFGARFYGGNFTAVNYYNTSANNTFPSGYSAFFAVNLDSRKMVWSTAFSIGMGPEDMPPAVWNGIVVGGYAQTFGNSSALGTDLAPGGNVMPINRTTLDAYLIGMNSTTGKILWKIDEGKGTNPPRAAACSVY